MQLTNISNITDLLTKTKQGCSLENIDAKEFEGWSKELDISVTAVDKIIHRLHKDGLIDDKEYGQIVSGYLAIITDVSYKLMDLSYARKEDYSLHGEENE